MNAKLSRFYVHSLARIWGSRNSTLSNIHLNTERIKQLTRRPVYLILHEGYYQHIPNHCDFIFQSIPWPTCRDCRKRNTQRHGKDSSIKHPFPLRDLIVNSTWPAEVILSVVTVVTAPGMADHLGDHVLTRDD